MTQASAAAVDRTRLSLHWAILAALIIGGTLSGLAHSGARQLSENEAYRVLAVTPDETFATLAERYLGDADEAWRLAELNPTIDKRGPRVIVLPKRWHNPTGISAQRQQRVPILTYHRFGPRASPLMVTPERFAAQLTYLRDEGYHVVPLAKLRRYLAGEGGLPQRAVVITIDDGYQSTYKHAYPALKAFGFPATVFVYTDFANRGGLKTAQMLEMLNSGLIDIQSHSKSHANLTQLLEAETSAEYQQRLQQEIAAPKAKLERLIQRPVYAFAYPYGAASDAVVSQTSASDHALGLTVTRGSNPFYQHPQLLRRSMVFGSHDLAAFARMLKTESDH
ncbi:MAG: polysaccharide deacetylase family protein [Pseudomonadota bacterium]